MRDRERAQINVPDDTDGNSNLCQIAQEITPDLFHNYLMRSSKRTMRQ
jgi:hypothetical protein